MLMICEMENNYRLRIKMIDRIKRQFDILQSQKKRLSKLSESFSPANPMIFQSFISTTKSIQTLTQQLSSFLQLLTPKQLSPIIQTHIYLISCLRNHLSQFYSYSLKLKSNKDNELLHSTTKNMNCSTCGQNIHQSNIKQAKIYLQEQTKQQFYLVMEQFRKIADQPIFTKEENNQYQIKLHAQLQHREKVLNTNCNRIQEFVQIMDTTLADLKKIQQIQLGPDQDSNNAGDFATAFRIGEDVSNFLQQSFSRKIPPWIHKMFVKMMTWYMHENSQKQKQYGVQANNQHEAEQKQIKQVMRQKRALQKQNKDISDELNQLKMCYKRLQQINGQYATMLANVPRNIKIKLPAPVREPKSRRNSKNLTKLMLKQDSTSRGQTPDETEEKSINYNILNEEENSSSGFKNSKRKKNNIVVLPKIKKSNKNDQISTPKDIKQVKKDDNINNGKNVEKSSDKKSQPVSKATIDHIPETKHKQATIQETHSSGKPKKKTLKSVMKKMEQKDHVGKDTSRDNKNDQNQNKNTNAPHNKIIKKQAKKQLQNRSASLVQQIKVADRLKQITNTQVSVKKSKTTKISKPSNNPKLQDASKNSAQDKKPDDDSTRQLYQYVSNIKLNKKSKSTHPHSNTFPISQQDDKQTAQQISNQNMNTNTHPNSLNENGYISVSEYNQVHNKQQMMIMRKISKDLSQYVNSKRMSMFSSMGLNQNQITNRSKVSAMKSYQESQLQKQDKNQVYNEGYQQQQQHQQQEYEQQQGQEEQYQIIIQNEEQKLIRNSDPSTAQKNSFHNNQKLRNSENYNQARNSLDPSHYVSKVELNRSQLKTRSLIQLKNSQQAQKLLFKALKQSQIIQNSVQYSKFHTLVENLRLNEMGNQQQTPKIKEEKPKQGVSTRRQRSQNNSIAQDLRNSGVKSEQGMQQIAHNSMYGRLFVNKAVAYKYQKSMAKSYHKKIMKELDHHQRDFCYQIYSQLCEVRKLGREYYNQFCSILRYPYQTLYTHFEVVNFVTQMSYDTFEYYFKKIAWIHRKCDKDKKSGLCHHLQSLRQQIVTLLEPAASNS